MSSIKISQAEAEKLLKTLKRSLVTEIDFPSAGNEIEFNVIGDRRQDTFAIDR